MAKKKYKDIMCKIIKTIFIGLALYRNTCSIFTQFALTFFFVSGNSITYYTISINIFWVCSSIAIDRVHTAINLPLSMRQLFVGAEPLSSCPL